MTVEVFAADEQSAYPIDTLRWVKLAEAVLADEGVKGDAELSLLFVDETSIADLNQRFLGREGPTDVLAFPIDEEPAESGRSPDSGGTGPGFSAEADEAPALLGDVVICPTVAARNAPDHAGTFDDEVALLVVHGVLHLLGMDHLEASEAAKMESRERELLGRHHGIVPGSALAAVHLDDDADDGDDDGEDEGDADPGGAGPGGAGPGDAAGFDGGAGSGGATEPDEGTGGGR